MLPGFLPFLPDPSVVKEGHAQSIMALVTVKSFYQVCDIFGDLLRAAGCAVAVKSKLATGNARDYHSIFRLPNSLALQLPFLCQFEMFKIPTVPLKNSLRQPGHEYLV